MNNTTKERLENYVIFRRDITSDFRNKQITRDEMLVYFWLRLNANSYGIATASLSDIDNDLFYGRKSTNYVNKIFLSLKKQKRIFYSRRTGSRGSFHVHFADFIHPKTKQITNLDKHFLSENIRTLSLEANSYKSEPIQTLSNESQNSKEIFDDIKSLSKSLSIDPKVRTYNNDNNKDKNTNNNQGNYLSFKEPIFIDLFKPKSSEEERCLEIARIVGELKMNFLLSVLKRSGIAVIEEGFSDFESQLNEGIKDKSAFFNSKVQLAMIRMLPDKKENLY